jgi:ribosomal protein S18 acetylase RimI-like enzyme
MTINNTKILAKAFTNTNSGQKTILMHHTNLFIKKYLVGEIPEKVEANLGFCFILREGVYYVLFSHDTRNSNGPRVVGGCLVVPEQDGELCVLYIEVKPEQRNKGCAKHLLYHTLRDCFSSKSCKQIYLINEAGIVGDRLYWSMARGGEFNVRVQKRNKKITEERFVFTRN